MHWEGVANPLLNLFNLYYKKRLLEAYSIRIFHAVKILQPFSQPFIIVDSQQKVAEGFGFQTLQTLQLWSEKTRAGLDQTTRRVVCPKPGLVGMIQEESDCGKTLKTTPVAEGFAEPS